MAKQLHIRDVALLGRTLDEYRRIFSLSEAELAGETILDVASGVSSFCAEANELGGRVTASDRIYALSAAEIEAKCLRDLGLVMSQMPKVADMYVWDYFPDVAALARHRERAARLFLQDFAARGTSRYVPIEYPETGFADGQFTLALVSHFLFLYEDRLSYEFHRRTVLELLRIASKEIRVFPLVNLKGERSALLESLLRDRGFSGCRMTVERVSYEFLRGADEMLRIRVAG